MSEYLSLKETKKYIDSLTLAALKRLANQRGLVVGGSGRGGALTKRDLLGPLGAHLRDFPSHVRVRADRHYHNGGLPDRLGVEWQPDEERVVPLPVFYQLQSDAPEEMFTIVERLNVATEANADDDEDEDGSSED